MILASHNQKAANLITSYYQKNRMQPGDKFYIPAS